MKEDCSMQTDQHRKMSFCQRSSACSEVRWVDHGQLNAGDVDQPPRRSAGTSPTDTVAPSHADTCRRSCITWMWHVLAHPTSEGYHVERALNRGVICPPHLNLPSPTPEKSNKHRFKARMRLPMRRHSNLGPILHRFKDIAGFCDHDPSPIPP